MILDVPARAIALGLLVQVSSPACASHVDVGFTSEGGVQGMSAGDASRANPGDAADSGTVMTAACSLGIVCNDGGKCGPAITFADWCTEVCKNSIDVCDNECVDLSSDHQNCGHCGRECSAAEKCVMRDCKR